MSYAIIGFGNIGRALAKAFARKGIEGAPVAGGPVPARIEHAEAVGPVRVPAVVPRAPGLDGVQPRPRREQDAAAVGVGGGHAAHLASGPSGAGSTLAG